MTRRDFPPAHPDIADLLHETPSIRRAVRRRGVSVNDVDDILQDVLLGAIVAIAADKYRPDPYADQKRALCSWLMAIARNLAGHFLCSARVRLETVTEPGHLPEGQVSDPISGLMVQEGLAMLCCLKPERRVVVEAVIMGHGIPDIAQAIGAPEPTIWTRLRLGRRDLRAASRRVGARER